MCCFVADQPLESMSEPPEVAVAIEWTSLAFKFTIHENEVRVSGAVPALSVAPGGCTWEDIRPRDPDFRYGKSMFEHNGTTTLVTSDQQVFFQSPLLTKPLVVVWLSDVDFHGPLCISISATDVSKTGFTLRLDIGGRSRLRSVVFAWCAYPEIRNDIFSGSIRSPNTEAWRCSSLSLAGKLNLRAPASRESRMLLAVNALDLEDGQNFTLQASSTIDMFTVHREWKTDMLWSLSAGPPETRLYSVGISYLTIG